jgi:hypothetical protein
MTTSDRVGAGPDRQRDAESVLKRLGYSRIAPGRAEAEPQPAFWVQEAGVPRRKFPVFVPKAPGEAVDDRIERWVAAPGERAAHRRAIFVVPNDADADRAWDRISKSPGAGLDAEVSILVMPSGAPSAEAPHFHLRLAAPREILSIATGIVVGLFRRAQATEGSSQIDFEELLGLLQQRFGIDVHRSLGVKTDEDALFLLYQLAQRDSYAPGDPGANLHLLVLKPTGPSARLPWFAA